MGKTTITFRLDADKREALDAIAEVADRDRSYVLNEAIDAYLDAHQWQIEHIKKGLRQAEIGQFASAKEVARAFARWRR
jgi:predicted transcriptional regulator